MDADPEIFWQFLTTFQLTVDAMLKFLPVTTNFDRSLRRIVAVGIG